ncbi:MAG: HAD-IIB family hydrolase [Oscillospiraceae bacterium]|nr:HAD-IIB family hydrolase [Oscillospiraceae bacterium]
MKTLYISDLDGTLLNSHMQVSRFTADTLNSLIDKGLLFSYATARSIVTAGEITKDITARFPLILYNGTMVVDNVTKQPVLTNFFPDRQAVEYVRLLTENSVSPLIYHFNGGTENMSFIKEKASRELKEFIYEYEGPIPHMTVETDSRLEIPNTFYIVCIDSREKLHPVYLQLKDHPGCNAIYHTDVYSGRQWLELMPKAAGKAGAVMMLKEKLGCDRVVCFGDGKNDISMFEAADECYAVANAVDELKATATGIIGTNDSDGVAKWLLENAQY